MTGGRYPRCILISAPRLVWTHALQFAAADDGWVIMRLTTSRNTACLMDWSEPGFPSRFETPSEALAHVTARHGVLYDTALDFLRQQAMPRTGSRAGAWEGACGASNGLRRLLRERERAARLASVTGVTNP